MIIEIKKIYLNKNFILMELVEVKEEEIIEGRIDREEDMMIKGEEVKVEVEEAVTKIGGEVKDKMGRETMIMIKIKILNQMNFGVKMIRMLKKKKVMIKIDRTVKLIIMITTNIINKIPIKNMIKEIVKIEGEIVKMGYKKGIAINKKRNLTQNQIIDYIM
jgi:hypothetical protein